MLSTAAFSRLLEQQRQGNAHPRLYCIREKLLSPQQLREVDELILELVVSEEYEQQFILDNLDKSLMDD